MRHKDEERDEVALTNTKTDQLSPPIIDVGIDLSEFYMSVEWDILQVSWHNGSMWSSKLKVSRCIDC